MCATAAASVAITGVEAIAVICWAVRCGKSAPTGWIRFRLSRAITDYGMIYPVEESVEALNLSEMAVVARSTSIPLCAGERLTTKYEFARLIESKAAAIFNFDLGRVGGILEARKI